MLIILHPTERYHICLEVPESDQTEPSHCTLAEPSPEYLPTKSNKKSRVPSFSELSLETSRAELIGLSFKSSPNPKPTSNLKSSREPSRVNHRAELRQWRRIWFLGEGAKRSPWRRWIVYLNWKLRLGYWTILRWLLKKIIGSCLG